MPRTLAIVLFCALAVVMFAPAQQPAACPTGAACPVCDPPPPSDPLTALREGNSRFVAAGQKHPRQSIECAKMLACCQKPFAVILSCSDSRVPPDVLFDQGVGDLFIIRVAGNVAPSDALGSIEYAVDHFATKLVVVMGHERCGAVQAAFCPKPPPHIDALWSMIRPAVAKPFPSCDHHESPDPAQWDLAVRKNAINMAAIVSKDLQNRPGVNVVSAYYSLDTGKVEWSK